jgi:hypothetical protein
VEFVMTGAVMVGTVKLIKNGGAVKSKIHSLKMNVAQIAKNAFQRKQASQIKIDTTSLEGIARTIDASNPKVIRFFNEQTIKPKDLNLPTEFTSDVFTRKIQWSCTTGTKQTCTVVQRGDIDWNLIRTKGSPIHREDQLRSSKSRICSRTFRWEQC